MMKGGTVGTRGSDHMLAGVSYRHNARVQRKDGAIQKWETSMPETRLTSKVLKGSLERRSTLCGSRAGYAVIPTQHAGSGLTLSGRRVTGSRIRRGLDCKVEQL